MASSPSAAKWNILGSNDASFNDGTGIADGVITPDHLALAPGYSFVATSENTTSTSYTGLTTPNAVTVTIGANGLALVSYAAATSNTSGSGFMAFAVSGATTVAANDDGNATRNGTTTANSIARTMLVSSLNAGSNTFTLQFKVSAGTGTWEDRSLTVVPL